MYPGGAPFCVSVTLDVEMCTNFPYWTSVWDHRKGAIDADTRGYVEKLTAIAEEHRAPIQWFVLGSSLEEEPGYLRGLAEKGHAVGNHTFRHVNVKAARFEDLQVTYRSDPGLAAGFKAPLDAVDAEIGRTNRLIRERLEAVPRGFRTPGGFSNGLEDAGGVRKLLRSHGFEYVSSQYRYPATPEKKAWEDLAGAMEWSLMHLQPFRYPDGLLEIPMMGISDVWAFRVLDLEREEWIRLLERGIEIAREHHLVYSILAHPHVLASRDPHGATLRRVLRKARDLKGWIATNDAVATFLRQE